MIAGAEAVLRAFAGQFADPTFESYVRTTEQVRLDQDRLRAAENGRWIGRWRGIDGGTTLSGAYLAVWKKLLGLWIIESELYVQLASRTPAVGAPAVRAPAVRAPR